MDVVFAIAGSAVGTLISVFALWLMFIRPEDKRIAAEMAREAADARSQRD
jgi:hypothetical protein